ncbi:restriction endonuclease subunit S [Aeromonas caviae]
MSSEWPLVRIEDIAANQPSAMATGPFGSSISAKFFQESGIPVIRGSNLSADVQIKIDDSGLVFVSEDKAKEFPRCIVSNGDLVFTCWGTINQVGLIDDTATYQKYLISNKQMKLTVDRTKADPRFVYYVFSGPTKQSEIIENGIGSSVPGFNLGQLRKHSFRLPPLEEQAAIADLLDIFSNRIALLRETNATLEAIAQALFKSWFVNLDPVHARARGEEPAGLAPEVAALFPDSFEESEVGLVPKGWKFMPFGELLSHTIGGDWGDEAPNDKNDTQVAIIRGTDMPGLQSGMIGRVPVRYTSQKKLASRKLQDGDLVLEVSGGSKDQPTGRSLYMTNGLLDQFNCPVEPASFCRLLRPASHDLGVLLSQHMTYIYADGKTWQYQNQSTGIANFQTTHFLETELVAVPTDDVLKSFAEIVRSMIDRSHLTQIAQLATLRDTLLPRLISGQQRLPEAEAMVREVQE